MPPGATSVTSAAAAVCGAESGKRDGYSGKDGFHRILHRQASSLYSSNRNTTSTPGTFKPRFPSNTLQAKPYI
jgi:hypothetical protein